MWWSSTNDCDCEQKQQQLQHQFFLKEPTRVVDIGDISIGQTISSLITFLVLGFSAWWLLFGQESFQKKNRRRKRQQQQQRTKRKRACKVPKQQQRREEEKKTETYSRSSVPKALIFKTDGDDDDESGNTLSDDDESGNTLSDDESSNDLSDEDEEEPEEEENKMIMTDCSFDSSDQQTMALCDVSDQTTLSGNMSSSTNESKVDEDEWEEVGSSSKSSFKQQLKTTTPFIKFKKSTAMGTTTTEKVEPTLSKHSERISPETGNIENSHSITKSTEKSNCGNNILSEKQGVFQTVVFSIQGNLNGDCAVMLCNVLEYQIECIHRVSINLVTATATIRCYERSKEVDLVRIVQILERFSVKASIIPDAAAAAVVISSPNQIGPIQRPTRRLSLVEPTSQVNDSIQRPRRLSYRERHMSI